MSEVSGSGLSGPGPSGLSDEVASWFARRTWQPVPWSPAELLALKGSTTVSVVLPALNEEETVAGVVSAVRAAGDLVDEVVVMDGGCTDRTVLRALEAGARVVALDEVLPGLPPLPGKGEVLWRSLAATKGDVIVFVDADLVEVGPEVVTGLLGPLLTEPDVQLVKGFYRRPLRLANTEQRSGGGRVTELMARPLLARFAPRLSGVVQPLGGEYAARRDLLTRLPFAGGYGVEIALLMDTLRIAGLDAIAQVDLGVRKHRNRDLADLGVMASEILAVVLDRAGVDEAVTPVDLVQFQEGTPGGWHPVVRRVERTGRGPVRR
ncbi:glucosyl-3-phosphoglycerate synthase [Kineosporia succinea]|uniref:Glucosyl-3-phosphoglycerate synthase n=1 Tax=Kineosporia succinea TaxID=84632 RepID=A0ABT9NYI4_9ACTN|nr:glucosyl-3-phosphoglycerate synthase [Kineosporia succinea]MDP9825486.1 glucosyl-3-phosphoglycerate synthase [Kineosporia succinea]